MFLKENTEYYYEVQEKDLSIGEIKQSFISLFGIQKYKGIAPSSKMPGVFIFIKCDNGKKPLNDNNIISVDSNQIIYAFEGNQVLEVKPVFNRGNKAIRFHSIYKGTYYALYVFKKYKKLDSDVEIVEYIGEYMFSDTRKSVQDNKTNVFILNKKTNNREEILLTVEAIEDEKILVSESSVDLFFSIPNSFYVNYLELKDEETVEIVFNLNPELINEGIHEGQLISVNRKEYLNDSLRGFKVLKDERVMGLETRKVGYYDEDNSDIRRSSEIQIRDEAMRYYYYSEIITNKIFKKIVHDMKDLV